MASCVLVVMYGGEFLVFFPKCSSRFSDVLFITANPVTSVLVYNNIFVLYGVLVLGRYKYVLDGSLGSEVSVDAILSTYPSDAFAKNFCYGITVSLVCVFFFLVLLGFFFVLFFESVADEGCLHLVKISLMFCNSVLKSFGVAEAVLFPCVKVLMMLYVAPMW